VYQPVPTDAARGVHGPAPLNGRRPYPLEMPARRLIVAAEIASCMPYSNTLQHGAAASICLRFT